MVLENMISVKDNLPEIGKVVYAACEGSKTIYEIKRIAMSELHKKWQWSGCDIKTYFTLNVTHWMYKN